MKTYLGCLPCFLRQTYDAITMATEEDALREKAMRRVMAFASEFDFSRPPPLMGAEIHRVVRQVTGDPDPYRRVKEDLTRFVLDLLPDLERRVAESDDPFDTALRLAIAGNIIDFSIADTVETGRILDAVEETLTMPFARDDSGALRAEAEAARSILYLADNAGEIVFDRLLLGQLPADRVTFAVKGSPVINDAVRADADLAGVSDMVRVVDNGTDIPGTWVPACPEPFQKTFYEADLVLSKGQGNYETLSAVDREVFFVLRAKCATIEQDLGCRVGDLLVFKHAPS
jgi:uncharacterized protein with ATP-grasp and redox domains